MTSLPRRKILQAAAVTALGGTLAAKTSVRDEDLTEVGGWFTKSSGNKHMPAVSSTRDGKLVTVTLEVKHPQGASHHISDVRVYDEDRIEVARSSFSPTLSKPSTTMTFSMEPGTKLFAVSDCNKHGLWFTEFSV